MKKGAQNLLQRGRRDFLARVGKGLAIIATRRAFPVETPAPPRKRTLLDQDWRFTKGDPPGGSSALEYDVIKPWLLPTGNNLIKDAGKRATRPAGDPGDGVPYVGAAFDDTSWRRVDLPHDYAIEGPFSTEGGGGMGRLPSAGVVWYRKNLTVPASSAGKSLFL